MDNGPGMSDDPRPLSNEHERLISMAEKRIQKTSAGFPPNSWIETKQAKLVSADSIRYLNTGQILRVGHRYDRGTDCMTEGRWVVVHSFWSIPKWGIVPWVCYPLIKGHKNDYLMGADFRDVELNPEGAWDGPPQASGVQYGLRLLE